ncbi:C-type lectin-like [Saccostrea cucullata]|uniref:C-type lectin-like n=1 Tax=Saccostrea cuccullata TaxID=36930 RepID=UPI002ED4FB09
MTICAQCFASTQETSLERLSYFNNFFPSDSNVVFSHFEGISRITCATKCIEDEPLCTGILYYNVAKSCKLLNTHLYETSLIYPQDGWRYWRIVDCDPGWTFYSGYCYNYFNQTKVSWSDAEIQCERHNAYLTDVNSLEENTWIFEKLFDSEECGVAVNCFVWSGGYDHDTNGTYIWTGNNSTVRLVSTWAPGEPNDGWGDENCIAILRSTGKWYDAPCYFNLSYVCKKVYI